jgi:hypothetical protein
MTIANSSRVPLLLTAVLLLLTLPTSFVLSASAQEEQPPAETADQTADDTPAEVSDEPPAADEPPADDTPADTNPEKVDADVPLPNEDDPAEDAETPEPMPESELTAELAKQAIAAKSNFRPITAEQVEQARIDAKQAAAKLEQIFIRGDDLYEETWKEFLHWNDLQAGLEAGKPDYQALSNAYDRFRINIQGNELSKFTNTRDALRRYLNLSFGASQENLEAAYGQILDRLASRLQQQATEPSTDHTEEIGRLMGWLTRYQQAPELTKAIAAKYSQPNLFAEVSEAFVATGLKQDINRETNVVQCILGTSIRGNGYTFGSTSVQLVPSDTRASMNMVLTGVTNTTNVGVNGPVTIHSTAQTSFNARLPLMFTADGLTTGTATAWADSNSQITGIGAKLKIIRKIARKKVYQSKGQAEAAASRMAAERVASELNSESVGLVVDANNNYDEKFRDPLTRRGAFPGELSFRTDADRVYVQSLKDGPSQLAAYSKPPSLSGPFDMALRFHESAVSNYAEDFIGGETLTDEKLVEMIKESGREVPEELKITPESDPWSITFASDQPVSVRLADNTIRLAIRGRRFTRQDQSITKAAAISALYRVERTGNGAKLVREGEVEVDYLSKGRQTIAETAFKAFLKNKFEAMFKPEFEFEGVKLPGRFAEVGTMQLEQLDIDGSWAVLGWTLPGQGAE